jgi:hypothetical protein
MNRYDDARLPRPPDYFLDRLAALHERIRDTLYRLQSTQSVESLSGVSEAREGDTTFAIDLHAEEQIESFFRDWGEELPLLLIAEGAPGDGGRTFPAGTRREDVAFTCIVDPIDGTRGLMYQKRSAWILSGIAPPPTSRLPRLDEIAIAMQTELPTARSHLSDRLWAVHGDGARGETTNLSSGEIRPFVPHPSGASSLRHGFATVSKFFPGAKLPAVRLEERLFEALLGAPADGNPLVFDDEYISTGGQLYELAVGHDRFTADLRPALLQGAAPRICSHPYDLCAESIAREAGVIVTNHHGLPLDYSLDIRVDCNWIGYANERLHRQIEPVLLSLLDEEHSEAHRERAVRAPETVDAPHQPDG